MTAKPRPIASLGALHESLIATLDAFEQRITERVVAADARISDLAFQVGEVHDRLVGLEDKLTEAGKHLDEVEDGLLVEIKEIGKTVDELEADRSIKSIAFDLNELADAERRRGLNEMRDELRARRPA